MGLSLNIHCSQALRVTDTARLAKLEADRLLVTLGSRTLYLLFSGRLQTVEESFLAFEPLLPSYSHLIVCVWPSFHSNSNTAILPSEMILIGTI